MKYSQWIGVALALLLVVSCFLPWTYHPDLDKQFTGFFSQNNVYGKPGKVFGFFAAIAIILFLLPRLWAKRWNLIVTAISLAFAIKTFILFSGCYRGICPQKLAGLWIMLFASAGMLAMALLPDMRPDRKPN